MKRTPAVRDLLDSANEPIFLTSSNPTRDHDEIHHPAFRFQSLIQIERRECQRTSLVSLSTPKFSHQAPTATLEQLLHGDAAARATSSQDSLASIWAKLESAAWIGDGSKSAPHVVYVISDPNCVWCHRFWEASRPWVQDGKAQLRHLLVGIVRPDSARKAATILSAKDPAAALEQNERTFSKGGIFPSGTATGKVQLDLENNLRLMRELEFAGTPAIVYKARAGRVEKVSGFPRDDQFRQVMGER